MDILKIPPQIIYKARGRSEDFGIGTEGTVGDQIYKCLKLPPRIPWAFIPSYMDLGMFNEAHYLCAVLLRLPIFINSFLEDWSNSSDFDSHFVTDPDQSVKNTILGIVYVYLGCIERTLEDDDCSRFVVSRTRLLITFILDKYHKSRLRRLFGYADPIRFLSLEVTGELDMSDFELRDAKDPEYDSYDWGKLTSNYNPSEVFELISLLGRRFEDRLTLMDKIITCAKGELISFRVSQATVDQLSLMKEKMSNELVYKDENTILEAFRAIKERRASSLDAEDSQEASRETAIADKDNSQVNHHVIGFPLSLVKGKDYGVELFERLVHKGFIANDADVASWLYAMGFTADEPEEFKPIEWLKNVQLAAEMIRGALDDRINTNGVPKRYGDMVPKLFTKDGRFMKLSRWKKEESTDSDELEYIFSELSKKFVNRL